MNKTDNIDISIIIPMYNGADNIRKCLENLDKQTTLHDFEVLIIDDASTDDSVELVKKMIGTFDNPHKFKVIECEQNGRAGKARNLGIQMAQGYYVLFIDQDDYPDTKMLEKLYELSENGHYNLVSCAVMDRYGAPYYRPDIDVKQDMSVVEKRKLFGHYGYVFASLIKRSILIDNSIVFPEKLMYEDALFNEGILACIDSVRTTDEILYYRTDDENSQTAVFTARKMNDRIDATLDYYNRYISDKKFKPYKKVLGLCTFWYVYLSCMKWLITSPGLYEEELFYKCLKEGKALNVSWKNVFAFETRTTKVHLLVLMIIYYCPKVFFAMKKIWEITHFTKNKAS